MVGRRRNYNAKPLSVDEIMGRFFTKKNLKGRLRENRAVEVWDEAVGESVAANAKAVSVREGVLTVEAKNNVWLNELNLLANDIMGRLNTLVGFEAVTELRFRVAEGPMKKIEKIAPKPVKEKKPRALSAEVEREIDRKLEGVADAELRAALRSFMVRGAEMEKKKAKENNRGNTR